MLICDFEGSIVFINETFSKHIRLKNLNDNSVLDFLHQEDIPVVIEQLVYLLQGKSDSIVIETRIVASGNQNFYTKWHVGYLKGLFYFYPIELPKFFENISDAQENGIENFKSQNRFFPTNCYGKLKFLKHCMSGMR